MKSIVRLLFFFNLCLFVISTSIAAETDFYGKNFEPAMVEVAIQERSVTEVLTYIYRSDQLKSKLKEGIRSGESQWLNLFIVLRQNPEAEWGGLLDLSLAYAVANNPEHASSIMAQYQLKYQDYFTDNNMPPYPTLICGNVDEDWELGCIDTKSDKTLPIRARDTLVQRQTKLESFNNEKYSTIKNDCLNKIAKAKKFWEKFCK